MNSGIGVREKLITDRMLLRTACAKPGSPPRNNQAPTMLIATKESATGVQPMSGGSARSRISTRMCWARRSSHGAESYQVKDVLADLAAPGDAAEPNIAQPDIGTDQQRPLASHRARDRPASPPSRLPPALACAGGYQCARPPQFPE
jgi:hypothetical protein